MEAVRTDWERRQGKTRGGESISVSQGKSGEGRKPVVSSKNKGKSGEGRKHYREPGQERRVANHCCESGLTRMFLATMDLYWRQIPVRSSGGFYLFFIFHF